MKNKRFFFKLILALLPVIAVILYTALVPYAYMDQEYPAWMYTRDVVSGKLDPYAYDDGPVSYVGNIASASTLILGDSRAMADLNPEYMDEFTVNLAVGGATPIEMYYTLNRYIKNIGTPKKIIIMYAPFHYSVIDNFWTRAAYFNYFSIGEMREIYTYAHAANSETLVSNQYFNDLVSLRLRTPDKYLPALINAKFVTRYSTNKGIYNSLKNTKGNAEFGHDNGNSELCYETSYKEMHRTGDAVLLDIYMRKLLDLCNKKGIETEVSIPPMNKTSFDALNNSYVEDFSDYMNTLDTYYPSIKVNNQLIYMDDQYFGDSSHLNSAGAEVFTKEYMENH